MKSASPRMVLGAHDKMAKLENTDFRAKIQLEIKEGSR
jgi:hypothetical protein